MRSIAVLMITIALLLAAVPVNSQDDYEEVTMIPQLVESHNFVDKVVIEGTVEITLDPIQTGDHFIHRISITIQDNITSIFQTNEVFKIEIGYDYGSTYFDPESTVLQVEDGSTFELFHEGAVKLSDEIALSIAFTTLRVDPIELDFVIEVLSYRTSGFDYDLEGSMYRVVTEPLVSNFVNPGFWGAGTSFVTHILVDSGLVLGEDTKYSISVMLDVISYTDSGDRLRIDLGDESESTTLREADSFQFEMSLSRVMELNLSINGGTSEIGIRKVIIESNAVGGSENSQDEDLPEAGYLVSIGLLLLSYFLVYYFANIQKMQVEQEEYL